MSSQPSTRSVSCCGRSGPWWGRRRVRRRAPRPPRPRAPRRARRGRRRPSTSRSTDSPRAPAPRSRSSGVAGRARVHPRLGARLGGRREHPLQVLGEPRAGRRARCRPKPRRGRHLRRRAPRPAPARPPARTSGPAPGDPAAYVGQVVADPLGERLRQLAPGAVVGEHLVAARLLDRRGQRPRAGDLDLEGARCSPAPAPRACRGPGRAGCGRAGGRRPARVGQPPARGLEVGAEPGRRPRAPRRHRGRWRRARAARAGAAGRAARRATSRTASSRVGRRAGADAGREGHAGSRRSSTATARVVDSMVAEPTTRVPSYITAA